MGAWGAGLYSDDTTCDVRESFVSHLKQGRTGEEAVQVILDGFGRSLENHDVECLVVFSLADTAWKHGRLTEQLRDRALALLDRGGDIHVWEQDSPRDAPLRRQALARLRARLLSEQPVQKPVKYAAPKPKRIVSNDPIGAVFLLNLPAGGKAAMVLVAHLELDDSVQPIFSVLDWRGDEVPTREVLMRCSGKTLTFSSGLGDRRHVGLLSFDKRRNPMKPLEPTGLVLPALPYDGKKVFVTVDRIAEEADPQLGIVPARV